MKEYIISVTFSIILCVGVSLLIPSPSYAGIMKIICGVFVVYTLLSPLENILVHPLADIKFEDRISQEEFSFNVGQSDSAFQSILSGKAKDLYEETLRNDLQKLYAKDIETKLHDSTLWVYNAPEAFFENIEKYVKEQYGLSVVFG